MTEAQAALLVLLQHRAENCPKNPWNPQRLPLWHSHNYQWEPLDGQMEALPKTGRYRITCFYGCDYSQEIEMDGAGVWLG